MRPADASYPFSDLALARRLERTEARSNASFVEARARLQPETGACWTDVAGAYAMFDGVDSPLTQTFGLGLFDPVGEAELDRVEGFFRERGAPVFHEVSPMAPPALVGLLGRRGYRPVELTTVLFRPVALPLGAAGHPPGPRLSVRRVEPGEADGWADVAARGWRDEAPELEAFLRAIGRVSASSAGTAAFMAERDGAPVAAGLLYVGDGVALLAGASTVPEARRQGAQGALLEARLRFAAAQGCDLAMMAAAPGSASQRNAERQGFRIAYTRIKWGLDAG